MRNYDERDYAAIHGIQEFKNCTPDHARRIYKEQAMKLADPDTADRASIITDNVKRGVKPEAPKKVKAKKQKTEKKPAAVREVVAPVAPTREVMLTLVGPDHPYVYTANLFGKKHAVVWAEIDHVKGGAEDRFGFVGVSERRLAFAESYSHSAGVPVAVAITVRVKGRVDQGYAIPLDTFEKFKLKSKNAATLSGKARKAYHEHGWDDCKFVEAKSEEKAA